MSADESDLENVNIKNRPMNIAGDYTELCSHAWLDAKNELDQHCRSASEEEKLQLLKKILMVRYSSWQLHHVDELCFSQEMAPVYRFAHSEKLILKSYRDYTRL